MIEPHTEADPAALLVQFLAAIGNIVGRNVWIRADGARHSLNLFATVVGATSKGRKGTSWSQIERIVGELDEIWKNERFTTGFSSAKGLLKWCEILSLRENQRRDHWPSQVNMRRSSWTMESPTNASSS